MLLRYKIYYYLNNIVFRVGKNNFILRYFFNALNFFNIFDFLMLKQVSDTANFKP